MADRDQLLRTILEGPERWRQYLASLSVSQVKRIETQLGEIVADYEQLLEDLQLAVGILGQHRKTREVAVEQQRRKTRVKKVHISLRAFLNDTPLPVDVPLSQLSLCTKTGATVLLEGLSFKKVGANEQTVSTANEAKRLFQGGCEPWAGYRLHYVRDGCISAGFGWDRPFLDEILVLGSTVTK